MYFSHVGLRKEFEMSFLIRLDGIWHQYGKFYVIQLSCKGEKEAYDISFFMLTTCRCAFGWKGRTFPSMGK